MFVNRFRRKRRRRGGREEGGGGEGRRVRRGVRRETSKETQGRKVDAQSIRFLGVRRSRSSLAPVESDP